MQKSLPQCAKCPFNPAERTCRKIDGKHPPNCPTVNKPDLVQSTLKEYRTDKISKFARQASLQEKDGYCNRDEGYAKVRPAKSRIEEIIDFIKRMEYSRVGLAFCIGLQKEAALVERLFASHGTELISAVCKAGRIPKEQLGLGENDKICPGSFESMCNPVLQAEILNDALTQLNIVLGLCVGHDSLFFQYSKAPATVLAVKDRVTGHNPLAPLYTMDSYYRGIKG